MRGQDTNIIESPIACKAGKLNSVRNKARPYGEWELNLKDRSLAWSEKQYSLYGYRPDELELNSEFFIMKTTHFSDIERISKTIEHALEFKSEYSFRRKIVRKDGKIGFVQTNAKIFRAENGRAIKIKGTSIDLGGQLQNENEQGDDTFFFTTIYTDYIAAIKCEIFKMTLDRDLTDDLCQEAFIKAWKHTSTYNPQKGELYTWLLHIAKNHCRDYFRSQHHRIAKDSMPLDLPVNQRLNSVPNSTDHSDIKTLMKKLPHDLREIIEMLFIKGYTQTELALESGMPLGTIKTKSRAAIILLRKWFAF
ncbi:MAG: sigma-70 family RNA polymerase sigma factor [Bacteroidota bacterium]|nr:sigma-70 family RNA polymerase sigma factor [Bacteroidota bacterium]